MLATAASSPPHESFHRILQVVHYVRIVLRIFTIRNGISIGSVVFARLARASNTHTQSGRPRYIATTLATAFV